MCWKGKQSNPRHKLLTTFLHLWLSHVGIICFMLMLSMAHCKQLLPQPLPWLSYAILKKQMLLFLLPHHIVYVRGAHHMCVCVPLNELEFNLSICANFPKATTTSWTIDARAPPRVKCQVQLPLLLLLFLQLLLLQLQIRYCICDCCNCHCCKCGPHATICYWNS